VSNLSFIQPVKVGDVVCVYTDITKTGRTSVVVWVEVWVLRRNQGDRERVTAGEVVLVAVDDQGRPRMLPPAG
jgi:acyl-CoA thioesterase YciA